MKHALKSFFYSFPVQLVLLHFKKFQVLLVFWFILFSAVNGTFMKMYGVNSLYLAPEYLGNVNFISTALVGISFGVFMMSWNITTFILFSRYFKFLATTSNPFLKYCINNAVIPLVFLFFYFSEAVSFGIGKELLSIPDIFILGLGFLIGLIGSILISFYYFFRAGRTIDRRMKSAPEHDSQTVFEQSYIVFATGGSRLLKIQSYFNTPFTIRPVRDVTHYSREFLETLFSRHHFAAVISIFASFAFLIVIGFFLDNQIFQLPAAASITIFFAILVAVAGAFSYFLQSWSMPFLIVFLVFLNVLFRYEVIDPTNKAFGLNYSNRKDRPAYDRESLLSFCTEEKVQRDILAMTKILNAWKARQGTDKPVMLLVAASGGGIRSASFTLNTLQYLDSISNGKLMNKTFLVTGSSGGMLGATYFRELSRQRDHDNTLNLQDKKYLENISGDLLNPMLSSFIARDLASPAQKFKAGDFNFAKDRGYAFEQKLSENTGGILNKQLKDFELDERNGRIPLAMFNSVITRDSRRMVISTQPVSFLMRPQYDSTKISAMDPDAVDFGAIFEKQSPMNLRLLTALRMNATFPYVLPNVWLPTRPVVDVMDAGLRDNYGQETALRFLFVFRRWIAENTGKVVLIQICDRKNGGWEQPFESDNIMDMISKPMLLLQYNYYKIQEYNQNETISMESFIESRFHKISFQYVPKKDEARAALNFHLTKSEKKDIAGALQNESNAKSFDAFKQVLQ